jgi:hypothetical protein
MLSENSQCSLFFFCLLKQRKNVKHAIDETMYSKIRATRPQEKHTESNSFLKTRASSATSKGTDIIFPQNEPDRRIKSEILALKCDFTYRAL